MTPTTHFRIFLRDRFVQANGKLNIIQRNIGMKNDEMFKHMLIQTNYSCTRKCSFCHYGQVNSPKPYSMDKELFFSIITQVSALNYSGRIGLFKMNEPLTDKRFPDFLKYAREKLPKAWIFISSNGDLLDHNKLVTLFSLGLNYVYLSSYDDKAMHKNTSLLKGLTKRHRKRIHHIDRTYQKSWTSRGGNIAEFKKNTVHAPCDMIHRILYIKPYGTVHSCYNDFYDKNVMGSLESQSILDIWHGEKFKSLRANLLRGNRSVSELCSQCDYAGISNLPNIPLAWKIWNK